MENGLIRIGNSAFEECDTLVSITIPRKVSHIDYNAFGYCDSLTEVKFKGNAPMIESNAFYHWNSTITFSGDAPEIGENCFEDVNATICYPEDNNTWTNSVQQNYGGSISCGSYVIETTPCTVSTILTQTAAATITPAVPRSATSW